MDTTDSEGWSRQLDTEVVSSFLGNVNFKNIEQIQKDYGLSGFKIDLSITTNENIAEGAILGYLSEKYNVIKSIPFDTHYLLVAQKWSSKSSILPSA